MSKCSWPNCNEEGTFPAPKNPRDLRGRQYFCQPHIKEFNKNWDGLKGFDESELWGIQSGSTVWERPVWAEGLNGVHGAKIEVKPFASAQDLFGFFQQRIKAEKTRKQEEPLPSTASLPADVKEACAIFSIPEPLPAPELKPRYLGLVKKNHPDVNKSPEAAEYIKRINVAYQILTEFSERRA